MARFRVDMNDPDDGAPAGYLGDAAYDDEPRAAARAPDVAVVSPGYFDPADLPYIANATERNHDEGDEAFFRRRVLALIEDRRDVYLRWAYDNARRETWSWCAWLAKQWRALRPAGRIADAVLPTYTRVIDDAVLRNVSAAVVANQENAMANPARRVLAEFKRDNVNDVKNALRWEDHLSNAFEIARVSVKELGKSPDGRSFEDVFADDMLKLERALRRHQILLDHYIDSGEREMRTGQASERFILTALRSGRIAELVREIAELEWPAMNASKFDRDGYCGNVTLRMRQIIDLCPVELGRARDSRERTRRLLRKEFPAPSEIDDDERVAHLALAYYTTMIPATQLSDADELYRFGAYIRTRADERNPTYEWRYFIRADVCLAITELLKLINPVSGEAPDAGLLKTMLPLLMNQMEVARTNAVDLFFPVSVADRIDALAARTPNVVSLIGAGAIVATEYLGHVHEVLALAQTQAIDKEIAREMDGAAREESLFKTVGELNAAWEESLDTEFASARLGGTATTAAFHLIPQKLKRSEGRKPREMEELYGRPLTRFVQDAEVDSDYWFDRREPVRMLSGANARALDVEIRTAVKMNVTLRVGDTEGGDAYASITQLTNAMRLDHANVRGTNRLMKSPVSVQIKILQQRLEWRASKCHELAVILTRLRNTAKRTTGVPQSQVAEAMQKAEADMRACVASVLPENAPIENIRWAQDTVHYLTIGFSPVSAMWQALLSYATNATSTIDGLGRLLRMIESASNPASDYYLVTVICYSVFAAMAVGTVSSLWPRRGMRFMRGVCSSIAQNAAYYFGLTLKGVAKSVALYGVATWQYHVLSNAYYGWENAAVPSSAAAVVRNLWHCARPSVYLGDGWDTCVARLEHDALVHANFMAVTKGAYSSELVAQLLEAVGRQGITDDALTQTQLREAVDATARQFQSQLTGDKPNSDYGDALVAAMQTVMTDRIQGRFVSSEARRMSWCDSVSRSMLKIGAAARQVGLVGETLRSGAKAGWGLARAAFSLGKFATFPKLALAAVNMGIGRCVRRADRAGGRSVNAMVSADALTRVLGAVSLSNGTHSPAEAERIRAWRNNYERYSNAMNPKHPAFRTTTDDGRELLARELVRTAGDISVTDGESRVLLGRNTFDNIIRPSVDAFVAQRGRRVENKEEDAYDAYDMDESTTPDPLTPGRHGAAAHADALGRIKEAQKRARKDRRRDKASDDDDDSDY